MATAAREYITEDLRKNREAAKIFQEMLPEIKQFAEAAGVKVIVCKCMDGRVQTNNHKGLPPTFAVNLRNQGNIIDIDRTNKDYWDSVQEVALAARDADLPLLIISSAHRGVLGSGCAAHKKEYHETSADGDRTALDSACEQAQRLRFEIRNDQNFPAFTTVIPAMTNTDTGGIQLFGTRETLFFDGDAMIESYAHPSDVFAETFKTPPISEEWAQSSIKGKSVRSLVDGPHAPYFTDMRVKISLETYLMKNIRASGGLEGIASKELTAINEQLTHIPENIRPFLTYVMLTNMMYATHYRNENEQLRQKNKNNITPALRARVSHAEKKLGYGTGFDLQEPNSVILVKPGGGNDATSLGIGRNVLLQNLQEIDTYHSLPPIAHINIQVEEPICNKHQLLNILARMRTKLKILERVFEDYEASTGRYVRVVTTYSYHESVDPAHIGGPTKQFFPMNPDPGNPRIMIDATEDIGAGFARGSAFDVNKFRERERRYTREGLDEIKKIS